MTNIKFRLLQILKRFGLGFIALLTILVIALLLTGNGHVLKAVKSTYLVGKTGPTIFDQNKFFNKTIETKHGKEWKLSSLKRNLSKEQEAVLKKWETGAFLIIQKDKVVLEEYFDEFNAKTLSNSFSVAKSITSIAIGAAINDGYIKSIEESIAEYLPEYRNTAGEKIKIKHLLQMNSGIDFGESYGDPFGFMAKTYYGDKLYDLSIEKPIAQAPGELWKYQGGNTLLLSFILEKAVGQGVDEYFSNRIWAKIGAQENALWTASKSENRIKSYCCFYSNARDFARIGKLFLQYGNWNGEQLVDSSFIAFCSQANLSKDINGASTKHYGAHWWLYNWKGKSIVYARGILGQYIVVVPEEELIMVRLGHKRDAEKNAIIPKDLLEYLEICFD